jgi:tripartite ATP-independent transporter DctM subunit
VTSLLAALLALIGTPLFVVIAALALLQFHWAGIDLTAVFIEMYRLAQTPTLAAIPLFAFTGFVLAESGAPGRLVRFSRTLLGWLPGGLAIVAILVCALFTALTGASGMTIVALGGLLYPALLKNRYPDGFSLGLLTTSGSLGLLFPPSLPLILFGIIAQAPIDQLFVAGIAPGLLLVAALSLYSFFQGRRETVRENASPGQVRAVLRESLWELLLPVVIFGGIYSGLIAVSEAAALSALYALIVEMAIHREIKISQLPAIMRDCMVLVGGILIVLAAALAYTNYLIDAEVPMRLLAFIEGHITSRLVFLILLNLFLLAVGCMIDMFSALVVVVPIILPIAQAYDVHPIHLGIIFLTNLEIGYSTPPVGLNLFIASMRFEKPVLRLYVASLPFLLILLLCLLVITYFPSLSLFLVES